MFSYSIQMIPCKSKSIMWLKPAVVSNNAWDKIDFVTITHVNLKKLQNARIIQIILGKLLQYLYSLGLFYRTPKCRHQILLHETRFRSTARQTL